MNPVEEDAIDDASNNEVHDEQNDQYLTFIMAEEEYGVDILAVQEIRGWDTATPIPNAPPQVKGVINLRGTIVPIVDLRLQFGLPAIEYGSTTVAIILKVMGENRERVIGIVVDAVSDVYSLGLSEMKTTPDLGDNVNTSFIKGLVTVNEKMVILLDLNKLLSSQDLPDMKELAKHLNSIA